MKSLIVLLVFAALVLAEDYPKVKLDIYMESLCPACKKLITKKLNPILTSPEFRGIIDLNIIPYGNGRIISEDPIDIKCQHGEPECRGNIALLCGFNKYPDLNYEYANCMERLNTQSFTADDIIHCGNEVGFEEVQSVVTCFNTDEGSQLHLEAAQSTPVHKYVPWVIIDGVEVGQRINFISDIICESYHGPQIDQCSGSSSSNMNRNLRDITEDTNDNSKSNTKVNDIISPEEFAQKIRDNIDEKYHLDTAEKRNEAMNENQDSLSAIQTLLNRMTPFKSFLTHLFSLFYDDQE